MDVKNKIKLTSYKDLFGEADVKIAKKAEDAETIMLDPKTLIQFPKHPFRVVYDESMKELIDSVKEYGILDPLWVIKRSKDHFYPEDGYYIIMGHRRDFAAIKAELSEVPVKVLALNDKEAIDYMIYSNIQRPEIYPSELAKAFKLQMEQNRKAGVTANETSEQSRKRQRYIRLTYLIDGFLTAVDEKKMQISVGYELSFLKFEQQLKLYSYLKQNDMKPTQEQAKSLKDAVKKNPELEFGTYFLDKNFKGIEKQVLTGSKKETEEKCTEDEIDTQEDNNVPGQTSIEKDFPEFLPEEKDKNEAIEDKESVEIEENLNIQSHDDSDEQIPRQCITGLSKYGVCSCCGEGGVQCCSQCSESCNNRCGWLEESQEPEEEVVKDDIAATRYILEEQKEQSELPILKNNDQRKEWLTKYKDWGLWYRDENIDVNYYKYDFPDGSRLIVAEYPQRFAYWNSECRDEHYYHLLEKNKKGYSHIYDEKYRQSVDSETYLVDFLKNLQKEKN